MNISKVHREYNVGRFTRHDGTIRFFNFVHALIDQVDNTAKVLDFGAGCGSFDTVGTSMYRRKMQDLRTTGAEVWAADVDRVVEKHPCSNHQVVLDEGAPLPFDDETFDMVVSDFTFEHIIDPETTAHELLRVLKPNGWICARTPSKWGYVAIASRMIPNSLHARMLRSIQPNRPVDDIFPTVYRLNTPKDIRRYFSKCEVSWYHHSADPSYYFGSGFMYRSLLLLHRLLPPRLSSSVCFFIQKSSSTSV